MSTHTCEEWQMQESATGRGKYCAACGRHTDQDRKIAPMTDPTPTPPPLDLAALREIAEVATPGTRLMVHDEQIVVLENGVIIYDMSCEEHGDWAADKDAPFIAAFDQPTVLALIARAEAAEAKIAAVRELLEHHTFVADDKYGDLAASQYYGDSELDAVAAKSITRALDGTA